VSLRPRFLDCGRQTDEADYFEYWTGSQSLAFGRWNREAYATYLRED